MHHKDSLYCSWAFPSEFGKKDAVWIWENSHWQLHTFKKGVLSAKYDVLPTIWMFFLNVKITNEKNIYLFINVFIKCFICPLASFNSLAC